MDRTWQKLRSATLPLWALGCAAMLGVGVTADAQTVDAATSSKSPVRSDLQPATAGEIERSFASYLHFPRDPAVAKSDSAVQFYCDVSAGGGVDTTYAVVGSNAAFNDAVRSALDWGSFKPATAGGKPVAVYLAGTVLFFHQDGKPVIVVSLATHDRARVGKMANYIQPQIIGGLRPRLLRAVAGLPAGIVANGTSEALVDVNEQGKILSVKGTADAAKDTGLTMLLEATLKDAQMTPAFSDGKPAAGAVNVIATFGKAQFDAERPYMYAPPPQ